MTLLRRATSSIGFIVWTLAFTFLLLEAGLRIYFSVRVGPDVLLWGSQWNRSQSQQRFMRGQNVFEHDNLKDGYSKYYPNQKRRDVDVAGLPFDVTINDQGFRGADYQNKQPTGTLRVLALGASSTFGFGNRDNETYPYLLEELLNERLNGETCHGFDHIEFINMGIPHLDSSELAALFVAEGLRYQPDAVTVYSGYNNTRGLGKNAALQRWSHHWLVINFVRVARQQNQRASHALIRQQTAPRTQAFIAGLNSILEAAEKNDIAVLPMTQQVRSLPSEILRQQRISYDQEIGKLDRKLQENGDLSLLEGKVLIHSSLTRALRQWAKQNRLELVDAIELLDQHRYLLTSYVHLAPLANHLLALALADALAKQFACPQLAIGTDSTADMN